MISGRDSARGSVKGCDLDSDRPFHEIPSCRTIRPVTGLLNRSVFDRIVVHILKPLYCLAAGKHIEVIKSWLPDRLIGVHLDDNALCPIIVRKSSSPVAREVTKWACPSPSKIFRFAGNGAPLLTAYSAQTSCAIAPGNDSGPPAHISTTIFKMILEFAFYADSTRINAVR